MQCSLSFNIQKGTLRGMHYQEAPHAEAKLVRCTRGAMYDVVVDLRKNSRTYKNWIALDLTAEKRNMLYVPEGCAHGFLTLADDTEVFYQMSEFYRPESAGGVRWNDPAFQIVWPAPSKSFQSAIGVGCAETRCISRNTDKNQHTSSGPAHKQLLLAHLVSVRVVEVAKQARTLRFVFFSSCSKSQAPLFRRS